MVPPLPPLRPPPPSLCPRPNATWLQGLAASAFTGYARENPEAVAAAVAGGAKWAYEHPEVAQSAQAAAWSAHPASASPQGHLGVESSVV